MKQISPTKQSGLTSQAVAVLVAAFGAAFMAAISLNILFPAPAPFIGQHLYDLYAQALIGGHFDLPARELRYEGHFTPDGTGYLYYGLGPILTRLPFLPFVDLPTGWISALSIWFWAAIGNAAFHRAFWLGLVKGVDGEENVSIGASALLAVAAWFGTPGLLLVGGGAVFYEPISMAYAMSGGFVLVIAMVAYGKIALELAIVPLAILAGITVHARPHLAVGYYVAVCLIALTLVWRGGMTRWKAPAVAMIVLALFGAGLLLSNALRFGNGVTMHGSFTNGDVQYASIFWGQESKDGPRARAFTEHGQFNAYRVLPNVLVYYLSPPSDLGMEPAVEALDRLNRELIAPSDSVNIYQPKVGALFLWPVWMLLMVIGLGRKAFWRMPAAAGFVGAAIGSLFILSYLSVTLRYLAELWAMIALPAIFGIEAVSKRIRENAKAAAVWRPVLAGCLVIGLFVTLQKTVHSHIMNLDPGGVWTEDFCLGLTAKKGFSPERGREICGLDPVRGASL